MVIPEHLINILDELLYELYENRLVVEKTPNKIPELEAEGRSIRGVVSKNVKWYRDLCSLFPSLRGVRKGSFDTLIKRANIIRRLEIMIKDRKSESKYAPYLIDIAEKRYQDYKYYEEQEKKYLIPWNNQF